MKLLERLPGFRRSPSGLEWRIWKRLPQVFFIGSAAPLALMLLVWLTTPESGPTQAASEWMLIYQLLGVLFLHVSMVLTVAIGCVVVMVMKGPAYVADAYPPKGREGP